MTVKNGGILTDVSVLGGKVLDDLKQSLDEVRLQLLDVPAQLRLDELHYLGVASPACKKKNELNSTFGKIGKIKMSFQIQFMLLILVHQTSNTKVWIQRANFKGWVKYTDFAT